MLRRCQIVLLILITTFSVGITLAQDSPPELTAENASQLTPINVFAAPIQAISPDGKYYVIGENLPGQGFKGKLVTPDGKMLFDFGSTLFVKFLPDNQILHVSTITTQSARVYQLSDMTEVGRFPQGVVPLARRYGSGYFYILKQKQVFYQPPDLKAKPIFIAKDLHFPYVEMIIAENPDGHTAVIASNLTITVFDLDKGEIVSQIAYPTASNLHFSADGKRLSMITNDLKNWVAYDMQTGKSIVEMYAARQAGGIISSDGKYGAVTRLLSDSGIAELTVFDLADGKQIFQTKTAQFSFDPVTGGSFAFDGDLFVYRDEFDGKKGVITVLDLTSGESHPTEMDADIIIPTNNLLLLYTFFPQRTHIFDAKAGKVAISFVGFPVFGAGQMGIQGMLFGIPDDSHPALSTINGKVKSGSINVRSNPSQNAPRISVAKGDVTALARTPDNKWIYLSSHSGWVSTDLVTLDGDIETLMASTP